MAACPVVYVNEISLCLNIALQILFSNPFYRQGARRCGETEVNQQDQGDVLASVHPITVSDLQGRALALAFCRAIGFTDIGRVLLNALAARAIRITVHKKENNNQKQQQNKTQYFRKVRRCVVVGQWINFEFICIRNTLRKYNNKDLSRLQYLSPGMRVNTRYIKSTRSTSSKWSLLLRELK